MAAITNTGTTAWNDLFAHDWKREILKWKKQSITYTTDSSNLVTYGNNLIINSGSTVDSTTGSWHIYDNVFEGTDSAITINGNWICQEHELDSLKYTNIKKWAQARRTPEEIAAAERLAKRRVLQAQSRFDIVRELGHTPRTVGRSADFTNVDQNEIVALQLLRRMVPYDEFKKYLKSGILSTQGPSGLVYKIVRRSHLIHVFDHGQEICTLCVYIRDHKIPPTDEVVAKKLIAECDEPDIWARANIGWKDVNAAYLNTKVQALGISVPDNNTIYLNYDDNYRHVA